MRTAAAKTIGRQGAVPAAVQVRGGNVVPMAPVVAQVAPVVSGRSDLGRAIQGLARVGFRVGEDGDCMVVASDGQSAEVRFRLGCSGEWSWRWSGRASVLRKVLEEMTDGSEADERLLVTFFVTADDVPSALSVSAAWREQAPARMRAAARVPEGVVVPVVEVAAVGKRTRRG